MKNGYKKLLIIGAAAVVIAAAFWFICYENKINAGRGFCCGAEKVSIGGIVPHHDLANAMIDEFYQTLSLKNKNIATFIILSPNHANIGNAPVITSLNDWQMERGAVAVDTQVVGALPAFAKAMAGARATPLPLGIDEKNIAIEHGVTVQLPFIKKYFPDARILPLAFSTKVKTAESFELAQALKKILDDESVFMVASLDFSHYLPLSVALEKDKQTMAAMKNFDYEKIASFGSDHVDSPQALITFLRAMELLSAKEIKELVHKNSSDFLAGEGGSVTTYYTTLFTPL